MNLSTKTFGLIVLLAFFIFSCTDPSEVGQDFVQDQLGVLNESDVPVETAVVLLDSIPTNGSYFTGNFSDNTFGTISATAFGELQVLASLDVPDNATFLSFELELEVDSTALYGTFPATQQVDVFQLVDGLENRTYYSFETAISSSLPMTQIGGGELTITGNSEVVSIPLSDALGESFLQGIIDKDSVFLKQGDFNDEFKGIALLSDGPNVLAFNPNSSSSKVVLSYRRSNTQDTSSVSFFLETSSGRNNPIVNFSNIETDRTGTPIGGQDFNEAFIPTDGLLYTQVGTGVATKVDLNAFKAFSDTAGVILINEAALSIGPIEAPAGTFLAPPPILTFYFANPDNTLTKTDGSFKLLPGNASFISSSQEVAFSLFYDSETRTYNGDMSLYLQQQNRLINNGEEADNMIFLMNSPDLSGSLDRLRVDPELVNLKLLYNK